MKRSDILEALEAKQSAEWELSAYDSNEKNIEWISISPLSVAVHIAKHYETLEFPDIRLKPKLQRIYFNSLALSGKRWPEDTHYSDLREDGTSDGIHLIKEIEK